MFIGLFVGIDRYASDHINELASARRDATALHAVFTDTLGGDTKLLVDEDATGDAIGRALTALARAEAGDIVVIAFSGHGAPSHHLVTYDTDPRDLDGTAIALESLTDLFTAIPARRLVCVLDCCFSGGMGAKVLATDTRARGLESVGVLLDRLSGEGRVILSASAANEAAWESAQLGHGLLTYHLVRALLGADEVVESGQVHLYRVFDFVTKAVIANSEELGTVQHPAFRGTIEGDLRWPVFQRGAAYSSAFPGWDVERASEDLASLEKLGFPAGIVDAWRQDIPSLNQLQLQAINDHRVLAGGNVLVSAPTSSGKTMIGELAAIKGALDGKRSVFLLPMRALVNDKYDRFTRLYAPLGIRTIRATGEIADDLPDLMRGSYDICLMTNEKFAALALTRPHLLRQIGVLVVDEAQLIADAQRGVALEFLLTMIKVRGGQAAVPQLILLSAVIGGANGLDDWLGGSLLVSTTRPVPLEEGVLQSSGGYRYLDPDGNERSEPRFITPQYGKGSSQDWVIPLVRRLVAEGEQVIVFRETRGEARGTARYLAQQLGLPPAREALAQLPAGDPSIASAGLREALHGGVAFHISDLDREERRVIEEQFRARGSGLRVIAATTTLAMGINTPATAVVIAGLEHPGDPPAPYAVAEYKNMVGRAGRLGLAPKGRSFVIGLTPAVEHHVWQRYVRGTPEVIVSHFPLEGGDPASLITRVLATGAVESAGMTADEITSFITLSFGAHLRARRDRSWVLDAARLRTVLTELARGGLVSQDNGGRYQLTALGRLAGESGTQVGSILRLATVLRGTPASSLSELALVTATQLTLELDDTYLPLNRRSTQKEPAFWPAQLLGRGVPPAILAALHSWPADQWTGTMRAKRAVGCLLWMSDLPLGEIERTIIQFGGGFDAAGPLRGVLSRTLDLLPTTIRVAEIIHTGVEFSKRTESLLARLDLGLPASIVPLALRARSVLTRGEYLALATRGIRDADAVAQATDDVLLACLGGSRSKLDALRRALARPVVTPIPPAPIPTYEGA